MGLIEKAAGFGIICKSEAMQEVLKTVEKVAGSDATVLITGETGVGKGLIVSAILAWGPRSGCAFEDVNCGALADVNTIKSELFGHEVGAYTDAHKRRIGKIERANKGTLFLDEIGELYREVQNLLLQVLERRTSNESCFIERFGGNEKIKVDVRFIMATNADLSQAVAKKKFREDLYFRISGLEIKIPPLRDRRDDIGPLADYYVKVLSQDKKKNIEGIEEETLLKLKKHCWPGNIRQLMSAIETAIILADEKTLKSSDFSDIDSTSPEGSQGDSPEDSQEFTTEAIDFVMEQLGVTREDIKGRYTQKPDLPKLLQTLNQLIIDEEMPSSGSSLSTALGHASRGSVEYFVQRCWDLFFTAEDFKSDDFNKGSPTVAAIITEFRNVWEQRENRVVTDAADEEDANDPPKPLN